MISQSQIKLLIQKHYDLKDFSLKHLSGYEDSNYLIEDENQKYLCKISTPTNLNFINTQHKLLKHIADDGIYSSSPITNNSNTEYIQSPSDVGLITIRLFDFLEGDFLINETNINYERLGEFYANLSVCLNSFDDVSFIDSRDEWNLLHAVKSLSHLNKITEAEVRRTCHYFLQQFNEIVFSSLSELDYSMLHGDLNLDNILKKEDGYAVIDFGDMSYGPAIFELGIGLCYAMLGEENILDKSSKLISAYNKIKPLRDEDFHLLYYIIGARAAVSICQSSKKIHQKLADEYSVKDRERMITFLANWLSFNPQYVENKYRAACKKEPIIHHDLDRIVATRNKIVSKSMSLSYHESIYMSKAAFQFMYDDTGKTYIDCVNNIPHVGHCHPHVVAAAQKQIAQLNTNTRYHYEIFYSYVERLLSKFPEELNRIFFVNSGSAATDLAIRLARTYTGKRECVVLNGAYHGNTMQCINLSPYKFNGKGGEGKVADIHIAEVPDIFRGKYEDDVSKYVDNAKTIMGNTESCCFIAESILSCGGQIVLPTEYMKQVYKHAADQNIVRIADEVQVGFGRVGHNFWGFELYDVIPDIVILGKPIGNGHPMAAVVTTDKIADAFNNGMEFFSSFGGNPVSCAIGNAVLDVIEQEHLQDNALALEKIILPEWKKFVRDFEFLGDARGKGLFLGLECVNSKSQKLPDAKVCKEIVESMKQKGFLLSSDGPDHNVIKFKPPMVFNADNVQTMNEAFLDTFKEIQQ